MKNIKKLIREIYSFVEVQKWRKVKGLAYETVVLHMIFKGNPGKGKTTVARLLGRLFKDIGVLQKGDVVEVERAGLVGEYIGHTAKKTREHIKKAFGGILFIDEAYSLLRGGEKDFGREAIDTIVKGMENYKNNLIIILAGYKCEMDEFINANPGLRSKFHINIIFPDYTAQELMEIAETMLSRRQYTLSVGAKEQMKLILNDAVNKYTNRGNDRMVRNLVERVIRTQAVRLVKTKPLNYTREDLMLITKTDLINATREFM